jgi:hypothetical protein
MNTANVSEIYSFWPISASHLTARERAKTGHTDSMPKRKRSRKLKTYCFRVVLEGVGELRAPRPLPQDKVLKMAREELDHITDDTLKDFTMSVSPLSLVKKETFSKGKKAGKGKKPKKPKKGKKRKSSKRKSAKTRGKQGLRIKRKK